MKNRWFLLTDLTCFFKIQNSRITRPWKNCGEIILRKKYSRSVGHRMSRSNYFSNRQTKPLQQWRDPRDTDHSKPINATKPQRFCQGESEDEDASHVFQCSTLQMNMQQRHVFACLMTQNLGDWSPAPSHPLDALPSATLLISLFFLGSPTLQSRPMCQQLQELWRSL